MKEKKIIIFECPECLTELQGEIEKNETGKTEFIVSVYRHRKKEESIEKKEKENKEVKKKGGFFDSLFGGDDEE